MNRPMRFTAIALAVMAFNQFASTNAHAAELASPPVPLAEGVALPDFGRLASEWVPSVVAIQVTAEQTVTTKGKKSIQFAKGGGSGVIWTADGYVLTAAHVIDKAKTVTIRLHDGREFPAAIVGQDARADVAVLKIEPRDLPAAKLMAQGAVGVGEWSMGIGSPFGYDRTVTVGIVSGVGRSWKDNPLVPRIQTDTALNRGNSGGPLLNGKGEVIGLVCCGETSSGIAFATPINTVLAVAERIRRDGKFVHGRIGLVLQDISASLAQSLGFPNRSGFLISGIQTDSPAVGSGVQVGDLVTRFNGTPVNETANLPFLVSMTEPGTDSVVEVLRDGKVLSFKLKTAALDKSTPKTDSPEAEKKPQAIEVRGFTLVEPAPVKVAAAGVPYALAVKSSPLDDVPVGALLVKVGAVSVKSADHALDLLKEDKPVILHFLNEYDNPKYIHNVVQLP